MEQLPKVVLAIGYLTGGGAERVVSVWANQLAERGFEVFIVVYARVANEYDVSSRVKILSIANTVEAFVKLSYWQRIRQVRKLLTQIAPQYVISFLPVVQILFFLASIGLNIKRIETIRVNPWVIRLPKIRYWIWRLCYKYAYRIILQTAEQADFFTLQERRKSVIIPNPISEKIVNNYRSTVSEKITRFIAVGRIDPQKNYPMMIDGFAAVVATNPQLRLQIFGRGMPAYEEQIRQYIESKQMANHITLMGRTPCIEEEYKQNDVFLMTSDYEGSPNALIEAMASRLLCIATACPTGPKDLITSGENGWLVPVGDATALAATIRHVLQMKQGEREAMVTAARERVGDMCSEERTIDGLRALLTNHS